MILHERSEKGRICACGFHCVDAIHEIADTPAGRLKSLNDPKIRRIIKKTAPATQWSAIAPVECDEVTGKLSREEGHDTFRDRKERFPLTPTCIADMDMYKPDLR